MTDVPNPCILAVAESGEEVESKGERTSLALELSLVSWLRSWALLSECLDKLCVVPLCHGLCCGLIALQLQPPAAVCTSNTAGHPHMQLLSSQ